MEDTINGLDLKTKEKDLKYMMLQDRLSETIAISFIKQFNFFSFHYVGKIGKLLFCSFFFLSNFAG
jgi:hypothetical protein